MSSKGSATCSTNGQEYHCKEKVLMQNLRDANWSSFRIKKGFVLRSKTDLTWPFFNNSKCSVTIFSQGPSTVHVLSGEDEVSKETV